MDDQKPRWWFVAKLVAFCIVAAGVLHLLQPVFNTLFPNGITLADAAQFARDVAHGAVSLGIVLVFLVALVFLVTPWSEWNKKDDSAPSTADAPESELPR